MKPVTSSREYDYRWAPVTAFSGIVGVVAYSFALASESVDAFSKQLSTMNDIHPFSAHSDEGTSETGPRSVIGIALMLLLVLALAACGQESAAAAAVSTPAATTGAELFKSLKCIRCHQRDGSGSGPSLVGLEGEMIPLANGETVIADDQYIRTSILNPRTQIRAGYSPDMYSYKGRISEEELSRLVEYIRSLEGGK